MIFLVGFPLKVFFHWICCWRWFLFSHRKRLARINYIVFIVFSMFFFPWVFHLILSFGHVQAENIANGEKRSNKPTKIHWFHSDIATATIATTTITINTISPTRFVHSLHQDSLPIVARSLFKFLSSRIANHEPFVSWQPSLSITPSKARFNTLHDQYKTERRFFLIPRVILRAFYFFRHLFCFRRFHFHFRFVWFSKYSFLFACYMFVRLAFNSRGREACGLEYSTVQHSTVYMNWIVVVAVSFFFLFSFIFQW